MKIITLLLYFVLALTPLDANAQSVWDRVRSASPSIPDRFKYTVPFTNRQFFNVIPDDMLYSLSNRQYQAYLKASPQSSNKRHTEQVRRVSRRLAETVNSYFRSTGRNRQLADFHWEFHVVRNSDANAFCMYGGKIAVYDGLFQYAVDDASLAIVLGHEIGHALAKHSAEQMTKGIIVAGGMTIVYSLISNSDMSERKKIISKLIANAGATLATLKYSREDEVEADRIGLIIAAMAGYDPSAAIPFWDRMEEKSMLKTKRDWFSTHPSYANRKAKIQTFLPEANRYYRKRTAKRSR